MKTLLIALIFQIATLATAAVPDCTAGAKSTSNQWMSRIQNQFNEELKNKLIQAYNKIGIAIIDENIAFLSNFSVLNAGYQFYKISAEVTDSQVSYDGNSDLFSIEPRFIDNQIVLGKPDPTYDSIGRQNGWSCRQYIRATITGSISNKLTQRFVGSFTIVLSEDADQKFPLD